MEHLEGRQSVLAALRARQRVFQVILISHGSHLEKIQDMLDLAAELGVPVKMVVYKGFGHGITKPKQQRAVMEENEKWFAQYIWGEKPAPPAAPAATEKKEKE